MATGMLRHSFNFDTSRRITKVIFHNRRRYYAIITDEVDGKVISPKEIKKYLDKYVIGQESAKIALATGTYQHYKRTKQNTLQPPKAKNMKIFASPSSRKHALSHVKNHPDLQGSFDGEKDIDLEPSPAHEVSPTDQTKVKLRKSNILMIGPTGSGNLNLYAIKEVPDYLLSTVTLSKFPLDINILGKTYLVATLARYLNVPFLEFDCTSLTATGYEGENIETIFSRLLQKANSNVRRCEHGIVYLDEVDKLVKSRMVQGKDVGGEAVQQGLLKVLEGTIVNVQDQFVKFLHKSVDTSNILFIASGAFSGLHKVVDKRKKKHVGFGAPVSDQEDNVPVDVTDIFSQSNNNLNNRPHEKKLKDIQEGDIIKYGFLPEFVGRIPRIVVTDPLSEDDLIRILTEPKNALVKQYKLLFAMNNCHLQFTEDALRAIARKACLKGTGARGLKAEMEKLLYPSLYEVPGSDISAVIINEECVLKKDLPVYRRDSQENMDLKKVKLTN